MYRIRNLFKKFTEIQTQGKTYKLFSEYYFIKKQRHLSGKSLNFLQFWINNRSEFRDTIQSRRHGQYYTVLRLLSGSTTGTCMDRQEDFIQIKLPQLYAHCLFSEVYFIHAFMTFRHLELLSSSGNLLTLCCLNSSSCFIDQSARFDPE